MTKGNKPGTKAPTSGIYKPSGGGTEIALSRGNRFPPTKSGGGWVLTNPTKKSK